MKVKMPHNIIIGDKLYVKILGNWEIVRVYQVNEKTFNAQSSNGPYTLTLTVDKEEYGKSWYLVTDRRFNESHEYIDSNKKLEPITPVRVGEIICYKVLNNWYMGKVKEITEEGEIVASNLLQDKGVVLGATKYTAFIRSYGVSWHSANDNRFDENHEYKGEAMEETKFDLNSCQETLNAMVAEGKTIVYENFMYWFDSDGKILMKRELDSDISEPCYQVLEKANYYREFYTQWEAFKILADGEPGEYEVYPNFKKDHSSKWVKDKSGIIFSACYLTNKEVNSTEWVVIKTKETK